MTPNRIIMAAMMGREAYNPFKKDRSISPTIIMTKMMAIEILPN
jgi:hypothetical protein